MSTKDRLNLYSGRITHTCTLIPYPLTSRVGKIRDVAAKLLDKPTEKSAAHYRVQVTEALEANLERIGVPKIDRSKKIEDFWQSVEGEVIRQSYAWTNGPTGGAA